MVVVAAAAAAAAVVAAAAAVVNVLNLPVDGTAWKQELTKGPHLGHCLRSAMTRQGIRALSKEMAAKKA